jgi:flagellar assembly protein FliH
MNSSAEPVAAFALPDLGVPHVSDDVRADRQAQALTAAAEEGYVRGYEDGLQAGRAAAEAEILPALQALEGAAASLGAVQAALRSEVEDALLAMAVAVAKEIVQRELEQDPEQLRELIRRAVDVLPMEQTLEVRLNPADLAALGGHLDLHAAGGRKLEAIWIPDATLERGGYLIETPQRVVDANLDEQFGTYYRRLRDG